jgi:hypothetical protein
MIGRSNRVYKALSRRRPLAMAMIRKLRVQLGILVESLIRRVGLTDFAEAADRQTFVARVGEFA